ncbi:MAG TPA: curli-like amyloid fiber formation chaperone CsgH [Burkholderiales bacterium]|nr:curli-like amyloid fiber formation chaperone CsgH [Burkholderiales bacterium]
MRLSTALAVMALLPAPALGDSGYQLDLGARVEGGSLKVQPTVSGPPDKALRYEMQVRREGSAGASNSSQSGTVKLDDDGHAQLASNAVSVGPNDRYEVTVRLLDGGRVVAEQSARYP